MKKSSTRRREQGALVASTLLGGCFRPRDTYAQVLKCTVRFCFCKRPCRKQKEKRNVKTERKLQRQPKKDKCIQRLKKHRYENKMKREYFGKWSIIKCIERWAVFCNIKCCVGDPPSQKHKNVHASICALRGNGLETFLAIRPSLVFGHKAVGDVLYTCIHSVIGVTRTQTHL